MIYKYFYLPKGINLIANEIAKPKSPIAPSPNAETLEIVLNSFELGFLSKCQTLTHFLVNEKTYPKGFIIKEKNKQSF